jgi:DNA repair ATPase RecN
MIYLAQREAEKVEIKDPDIFRIIEKLGDHFQNNVSNRFIRKALVILELQQSEWDRLENLTAKAESYKQLGFRFDELYEMVLAAAHFIHQARTKMVPNIRTMLAQGATEKDKILRDMAAQNFPVNLAILADYVNELYMKTTALDRAAHEKKRPVYERIPELKELGKYLVTS